MSAGAIHGLPVMPSWTYCKDWQSHFLQSFQWSIPKTVWSSETLWLAHSRLPCPVREQLSWPVVRVVYETYLGFIGSTIEVTVQEETIAVSLYKIWSHLFKKIKIKGKKIKITHGWPFQRGIGMVSARCGSWMSHISFPQMTSPWKTIKQNKYANVFCISILTDITQMEYYI